MDCDLLIRVHHILTKNESGKKKYVKICHHRNSNILTFFLTLVLYLLQKNYKDLSISIPNTCRRKTTQTSQKQEHFDLKNIPNFQIEIEIKSLE